MLFGPAETEQESTGKMAALKSALHAMVGGTSVPDAKRPKDLKLESSQLKKLLAEVHLDVEARKVVAREKVSPTARR